MINSDQVHRLYFLDGLKKKAIIKIFFWYHYKLTLI